VDRELFGQPGQKSSRDVVLAMLPYIDRHIAAGGRLNQITRHMLGLFAGQPGARGWRQMLSNGAPEIYADSGLVLNALNQMGDQQV
ncbi:MAG: tRNA dihydrouridine(20/20a) synthase DusA, partial [Paracoccaceae bacterium]